MPDIPAKHADDVGGTGSQGNKQLDVVEWIMALEYLKAKKSYDDFTSSFGKANFFVPRVNENNMSSLMQKKEIGSMPHDSIFGKEFQANVQIGLQEKLNQELKHTYSSTPKVGILAQMESALTIWF